MDQGTQFMSECMQEVSQLLSIKGLTSTPYHPICNGLVERWNLQVHSKEALPRPAEAVAQTDQPCSICLQCPRNDTRGIMTRRSSLDVTPDGQYEFTRMPFGMVNSGATLVRGLRKRTFIHVI